LLVGLQSLATTLSRRTVAFLAHHRLRAKHKVTARRVKTRTFLSVYDAGRQRGFITGK
jgi:hypothetical protein